MLKVRTAAAGYFIRDTEGISGLNDEIGATDRTDRNKVTGIRLPYQSVLSVFLSSDNIMYATDYDLYTAVTSEPTY